MASVKFAELEHTADAGLRVFGSDLREILENAAEGMFSLIGSVGKERDLAEHRLEVTFATAEDALLRWLQALLLEFDLHGFFPVEVSMDVGPGRLTASVHGVRFDPRRHEVRSELKAVTRHGLRVTSLPGGGLEAEVIFDV
jgi:SHS2 domain-containing protein